MKTGRLFSFLLALALLAGAGWALLNRQLLVDQYIVATVPLSSQAQAIEDQIKFAQRGEFLFKATQPEVEPADQFNLRCSKKEIGSVVLGCYIGPQNVYIYGVNDPQLSGVQQVTAAHEMLHAAYERLSESEKRRVNQLLETALPAVQKANPDLAERLKLYDRIEPGERSNELHSILGTEVSALPVELEKYYKQYFSDRAIVTNFADGYTKVFTDLKNNQDQLVAELKNLSLQINQMSDDYNSALERLDSDIESFNETASRPGGFATATEFESVKAELVTRRAALDTERQEINGNVEQYNQKRAQLQALNVQVKDLNSKLDSTALPAL